MPSLQRKSMRIIVNSDDLGLGHEVNDRIFGLMQQGRITSATLLMNAPAAADAVSRIAEFPRVSFGVHLNATEFQPLTAHEGLAPLLDEQGRFAGNAHRVPITREIQEAVFMEWCAQVERALALGVPVSHLDSHHHTHIRPGFFTALKRVQKKFGIWRVRRTGNLPAGKSNYRGKVAGAAWNAAVRADFRTRTTNWFASFIDWYEYMQAGLPLHGTIELMTHPGHSSFTVETELVSGEWKRELAFHSQLVSYMEL